MGGKFKKSSFSRGKIFYGNIRYRVNSSILYVILRMALYNVTEKLEFLQTFIVFKFTRSLAKLIIQKSNNETLTMLLVLLKIIKSEIKFAAFIE